MSVMGVTSPKFSVPVCNSFKAKIREDQLCYTVDPNIYRVDDIHKPLEITLLLDYNEERSLYNDNDAKDNHTEKHLTLTVEETEKRFIIVETIGKRILNRIKYL